MSKISIRQCGEMIRTPPIQTRDALVRDMLLTTNARLTAEPAPPGPDLGVRHDGSGGNPKQADIEVLFNGFVAGLGMLTPAEVSRMKALMLKFAGLPGGTTNSVGITSNDSVRQGVEAIQSMASANKAFWDKRIEADERRILGL